MTQPLFDGDPEPYPWIVTQEGEPMLDMLTTVREGVESLPETKTTFKVSQFLQGQTPPTTDHFLRFVGCWEAPDRFVGGTQRASNWVNPHAKWAPKYSDVAVVCGCGAIRYSPEFRADVTDSTYLEEKYSEPCEPDCPADVRAQTKADVWARRKRILETAANYCHPTDMIARRLDVAGTNVQEVAKNLGYDNWNHMREWGMKRRRQTWILLSDDYGFTHKDIAAAFGVSRQTVSDHIRGRYDLYDD